jgi:nitrile hydratase subunit alpha
MGSGAHNHSHGPEGPWNDMELRVKALESVLTEKGYIDPAALDVLIETYEHRIGPRNGARVVARSWTSLPYRARLLENPTDAMAELGFSGRQGEHMKVVENSADVHNLVVCTLCSCYPWSVLGLPPVWYKSAPYRSRSVIDPRGVLRDFGVVLPDGKMIRVWDSTAELRYLVIPERPSGTDGWSEDQLMDLVTRDSMIGTGLALPAGSVVKTGAGA